MPMPTVLLVEDDATFAEALRYTLESTGHTVIFANNGIQGLELARREEPDLVILDVMLPGLDGFSVCRVLRKESKVPVMMLTGRQDETDCIAGLEVGADDYVAKPFRVGELLARVRALLRRAEYQPTNSRPILEVGNLRIDLDARRAWCGDAELMVSHREFDLLTCLAQNHGVVLSRDVLLERVWGYDFVGETRTIDVHIRWLREKIEPDPSHPIYIQTVRGVGYRFEALFSEQ